MRIHAIGLVFFTAASLLLLRPLPAHFATHLHGYGDIWMVTWNFWWAKKALLEGLHLFHTDYLYYPLGVSLYFHALSPLNAILSVPFQLVLGPIATNNLFFIATFVLSGYAAYLIVHHLTARIMPSLIAGYVYAFSPYHFAHYQIEHLSLQWPAFMLLFLMKRRFVIAGLFFLATFYANPYYGLYSVILCAIFFLHDRKGVFQFSLVAAAGLLPYLVPMLLAGSSFRMPFETNVRQSLDLLAFITPHPDNPLLALHPLMGMYDHFTSGEPIGYLGISVIILACFARARLFVIVTATFLILSLGPFLHVAGEMLSIPLPQMILQKTPILSSARVPARYISFAMLGLAVLAGLGAARLRLRIMIILVMLIVIEYFNAPVVLSAPPYPRYVQLIASDPDDVAVFDLPHKISVDPAMWWMSVDPDTRAWLQTLHGKKSMTGPASHTALRREHFQFLINHPVLAPLTTDSTIRAADPRSELERLKLRYFVLHRTRYSVSDFAHDYGYLREIGLREVYADEEVIIMR